MEDEFAEMEKYGRFFESFNSNLSLLFNRLSEIKKISPYEPNKAVEWFTFFDCIIVQLRAMFIENERYASNYTYQNFLSLYGKDDIVNKINKYLNDPFINEKVLDSNGDVLTIKNAIKFLADKFICHYDETSDEERARMEVITNNLSNLKNSSTNNLVNILTTIFKMMEFKKT